MQSMKKNLALLCSLLLGGGCAVQHDSRYATLWVQTSAEYQGNSALVFNVAGSRLSSIRDTTGLSADINQAKAYGCVAGEDCSELAAAGLIPAVVLDIDETVLDNSAYQARLVKYGGNWTPDTWDAWVAERAATAVPGALAFIKQAKEEGIAVIYITNRRCSIRNEAAGAPSDQCPQKTDTLDNLASEGFPSLGANDLLILRNERRAWDESEKQVRREYVAERYRIMMLIGDDLGDLASNIKKSSVKERAKFVSEHQALLGEFWFQLTNPTYGSWLSVLDDESMDTYLRLN